ncbi:purine-cytosine permease family protein [Corynebacterium sphenisci]|uniref:purine-cytosine permease family protein n=1 Tax=Corynebacterium sphenisci TaxID=191493 RepID=UPI0009512A44|nr:hypothetical protein [Corynebacterium sphenisci]
MTTRTLTPDPRKHPTPAEPAGSRRRRGAEDWTLRYAPRSHRRWTPAVVAGSALGGIAYLADFSIGAGIGIAHGTVNAVGGILIAAAIIFASSLPPAYYAARYNLDLDLITRGAGFGYYGSVLTNLIFASFTFIFFATEGVIMAQGLRVGLGLPLWAGYLVSTVLVIPLVAHGMGALAKLQAWTSPPWLVMMVLPLAWLVWREPASVRAFASYGGDHGGGADPAAMMLAAGVCLSLIAQIAENIDYLRFMPPRTPANRRSWWAAVLLGGPGWVLLGAAKQVIGVFLAVYVIAVLGGDAAGAREPVTQFLAVYRDLLPEWAAVAAAVALVVLSQVKINVTNAYSGSLAWTNAYTRLTRRYPGRFTFVLVNLAIALALMEFDMFAVLGAVLSFYSNLAIAWIVTVATDIAVNKMLLGLSPRRPEFRRGMLHEVNPVGVGSLLISGGVSIAAYFGLLGPAVAPYSPLLAAGLAVTCTIALAAATGGRHYLRRVDDGVGLPHLDEHGNPAADLLRCCVTGERFERPDMIASAAPGPDGRVQYISSLALATDRTGEHVLPPDGHARLPERRSRRLRGAD